MVSPAAASSAGTRVSEGGQTRAGEGGGVGATGSDDQAARIAPLDGIRGVAILLVIAHNTGTVNGALSSIPLKVWAVISNAGWVGVQLFFALSGFLITRILLQSKGGSGWIRRFYVRRLLRIIPLYFAVLALVLFVAPHIAILAPLVRQARHSLWYWVYLSNWIAPFGGGVPGLPHVWSLAVEEQFYLVWPWVVAMASEGALAMVCVTIVMSAVVLRRVIDAAFTYHIASAANYSFTITRWDAIALGALVAIVARNPRISSLLRPRIPAAIVAVSAVLMLVTAAEHGLGPQGTIADFITMPFTAVFSALIVFACVVDRGGPGVDAVRSSWLVRLLSPRWLVGVGKYSYGLYMVHMPVNLVLRQFAPSLITTGGATTRFAALLAYVATVFGISLLLALASWRLLEQPMLALKRYVPTPVRRGDRTEDPATPAAMRES